MSTTKIDCACDGDQDALSNRVRKLKERHAATKQELQRIENLCIADKDMRKKSIENDYDEEDYDNYSFANTASTSALSVVPEGLRLPRGKNKSFSSYEVREIERKNNILMNKIVSHNKKPSQYRMDARYNTKMSNSQVNRRKKQQEIERENMILLKRIQTAKPFGLSKRK